MPSAFAQESEPLPDAEELRAANDSILAEAYLLPPHGAHRHCIVPALWI